MSVFTVDLNYLFLFLILCIPAGVFLIPMYWRLRERNRLIDFVRTAIEKGQSIPPEFLRVLSTDPSPPSSQKDFRNGIVLLAVGVGLALTGLGSRYFLAAMLGNQGDALGIALSALGAIPAVVGIAFIFLSRFQHAGEDEAESG